MPSQSLSNSHLGSQNPQLPSSCPTAFVAEHSALRYALSLVGSIQLSQLSPLPASCSPSACCWGGERGSRIGKGENLGAVQALFSNSQMSVCYLNLKSSTQCHMGWQRLTPSPDPVPSFADFRMERIVTVSSSHPRLSMALTLELQSVVEKFTSLQF